MPAPVLLACKPETIDRAEDRELFKETMEKLHQPIIPSEVVETLQDALACADRIGYPVIVRPAFTMGGTGGGICAALGLTGLAGGAAVAGCCAQMVGFAVMSYKD